MKQQLNFFLFASGLDSDTRSAVTISAFVQFETQATTVFGLKF
jgi:hypothetical protein